MKLQEWQQICKRIRSAPSVVASASSTRLFSCSSLHLYTSPPEVPSPRWKALPPGMTAPFRSKPPVYDNEFPVNESQGKLDEIYKRILGEGGDKMLTEEVKWLAVTHKSFDHGRRGYNDRLAFLGKRIFTLQASLALINSSVAHPPAPLPDQYNRVPFQHPALDGLQGLTEKSKGMVEERYRLAHLAHDYKLHTVIRWKPKKAADVGGSGANLVYAQAMCAIIGAVALQKGGEVANRVVRSRVLAPLGFK